MGTSCVYLYFKSIFPKILVRLLTPRSELSDLTKIKYPSGNVQAKRKRKVQLLGSKI